MGRPRITCEHEPKGCEKCRALRKKQQHKAWRDKNREHVNLTSKLWIQNNPEKRREFTKGMRFYGRTIREMFENQKGLCAICDSPLRDDSPVDHDHKTGWVRGILCDNCNSGIGMLGDDPERLVRAIIFILSAREAERAHSRSI